MNFLQVLPFDVVRQARKGETPKVLTLRTAHRAGWWCEKDNSGKALCSKCFSSRNDINHSPFTWVKVLFSKAFVCSTATCVRSAKVIVISPETSCSQIKIVVWSHMFFLWGNGGKISQTHLCSTIADCMAPQRARRMQSTCDWIPMVLWAHQILLRVSEANRGGTEQNTDKNPQNIGKCFWSKSYRHGAKYG